MTDAVVLDASAWVDALLNRPLGLQVTERITGHQLHAPAHVDLELLSAVSRMQRAGVLSAADVDRVLADAQATPIERHLLPGLTSGAWGRSGNLRVSDAYYVELAARLDSTVVTTDRRLARATSLAELVESEHDQGVPVDHRPVVPDTELGDQVAGGPAEQGR